MQLTRDADNNVYQIRAYESGDIQINTTHFHHSIIVAPNRLIEDWPPQSLSELNSGHFTPILELSPTIFLLGTGVRQQFPSPQLLAPLYAKNIGIEIMDTGAACRTYNILVAEGRNVVAALLIK